MSFLPLSLHFSNAFEMKYLQTAIILGRYEHGIIFLWKKHATLSKWTVTVPCLLIGSEENSLSTRAVLLLHFVRLFCAVYLYHKQYCKWSLVNSESWIFCFLCLQKLLHFVWKNKKQQQQQQKGKLFLIRSVWEIRRVETEVGGKTVIHFRLLDTILVPILNTVIWYLLNVTFATKEQQKTNKSQC